MASCEILVQPADKRRLQARACPVDVQDVGSYLVYARPSLGYVVQRLQSTPSETVCSQVTRLAKSLFTTCHYIDSSFNESRTKAREAVLVRAKAGLLGIEVAIAET